VKLARAFQSSFAKGFVTRRPIRWFFGLAFLTYLILIVFNVTTSSLSLNVSSTEVENTAEPVFSEPQPIRSDEWLRSTPYQIGRTNSDWSFDHLSPFEYRSDSVKQGIGLAVYYLVFPERYVAENIGARGLAFAWWFPLFATFFSLILLLHSFGLRYRHAGFTFFLIALSPVVSWWSYSPLEVIWPCALAGFCLRYCSRLRTDDHSATKGSSTRIPPIFQSALFITIGGVALSRLPFIYQPWSFPTFLIFAALILDGSRHKSLKRDLKFGSLMGLVTIAIAGSWYLLNRSAYGVLAATVYPGARRSEGGYLPIPLFSGPMDYFLTTKSANNVIGTNQSETSLGWLILFVVSLAVLFASTLLKRDQQKQVNERDSGWTITLLVAVVLLSWSLFKWPDFLLRYNVLRLIPSSRMIQISSLVFVIPSSIIIFTHIKTLPAKARKLTSGVVSAVVFVLTLWSALSLRLNYPELSVEYCWIVSVIFAAVVFVFLRFSDSLLALGAVLLFAFCSVANVNPVVVGQGDLIKSDSARTLNSIVRESSNPKGRVATDHMFLDALVSANGLYQLSGQQGTGPSEEAYRVIDPQFKLKDLWNRGASSLIFLWDESLGDEIGINIVGGGDVFQIVSSPCNKGLVELGLGWIISTRPLNETCLQERASFYWTDLQRWLYQVETKG
jgi:hypothetical protein